MADKPARVSFSPEQQRKVQDLIDAGFIKGRRRALSDTQAELDRLKAENVSLKARVSELENKKSFFSWRR